MKRVRKERKRWRKEGEGKSMEIDDYEGKRRKVRNL
jgi:hypothetical protein